MLNGTHLKNILNFTGGLGGSAGNHIFIQTGNNRRNPPNFHVRNGLRGSNGRDATPCKNTALHIQVDTHRYNRFDFPLSWANFSAEFKVSSRFDNPR